MKKTFFDYISSADSEKVHSQTIGWILSKSCTILNEKTKSNLLKNITKSTNEFRILNLHVEFHDIDILIECNDAILVIENKIKSSESEYQLEKYKNIIENGFLSHLKKDKITFFIYLTLFQENATNSAYINFTYHQLVEFIDQSLLPPENDSEKSDYYILVEYSKTLKQLTNSMLLMEIRQDIRHYIFSNTKNNKNTLDDKWEKNSFEIDYIIQNGLERRLQKYYFQRVKDEIALDPSEFDIRILSSASNGEGIIQVNLLKYNYNVGDSEFFIGLQIQGNVLKINTLSKYYEKSSINDIHPKTKEYFQNLKEKLEYKRINPPNSKAYYSISKPITDIFLYSPKELARFIENIITDVNFKIHIYNLWMSLSDQ